jgi:hypothetical protein
VTELGGDESVACGKHVHNSTWWLAGRTLIGLRHIMTSHFAKRHQDQNIRPRIHVGGMEPYVVCDQQRQVYIDPGLPSFFSRTHPLNPQTTRQTTLQTQSNQSNLKNQRWASSYPALKEYVP